MPTQANAPALKWHYTVLWHRSTVHTVVWAGLRLQVEGSVDRSEYGHLLEYKLSPVSSDSITALGCLPLHLITHCVNLDCTALSLLCSRRWMGFILPSVELHWDCTQSVTNMPILLLFTLPPLLPTKAKLQPRHYQVKPKLQSVKEQCRTVAFGCDTVKAVICYNC